VRIVFAGTPDFAVPTLEALTASDHVVTGVVTNPDRPSGRGSEPEAPPVKRLAVDRDLPVYQPDEIDTRATAEQFDDWEPEAMVVAAYGQILPKWLLERPEHGCLNVHASLLPKYRGAAPINWALIEGEERTGVTIMEMEPDLDTGPIVLQESVGIGERETADRLHDRLAELGAELAVEALDRLEAGELESRRQDDEEATYAPKLSKSDGAIDWEEPADRVANRVRGLYPWPGAFGDLQREDDSDRIKFHLVEPVDREGSPGEVLEADPGRERFVIACGEGAVRVRRVQAPGGTAMGAGDFLNGYDIEPGNRFH